MNQKLLPPAERKARIAEKRRAILRLLREEIYTTREVVQELLNVAPTPAKMTLAAMERDGLVKHQQVECPNGWRPHLWGITAEGQAMAFDENELPIDRVFEPGRVGLTVLKHTISLQLARIRAEQAGWTNWLPGDRAGKWEKDQARPDVVVTAPDGEIYALEMELTIKTTKRYESVIFDRLRQIKTGNYSKVIWILEDAERAKRLEKIIKSITNFTREIDGVRREININPDEHHSKFLFISLADWPQIERAF